jgi:O-antigen/teichoic acid export membrane protein
MDTNLNSIKYENGYIKRTLNHKGFIKYFNNASWLFISRVITMIVSFVVTAYIVRILGPSDYGQLSYAVSFVAIFSFISSLGIDTVLYRELVDHPESIGRYMGTAVTIKIFSGILATTLCLLFAFGLSNTNDISLLLISIISLSFIFNSFNLLGLEFQAKVESKHLSIASFIILITLNILKVIAIISGKGVIYLAFILLLEPIITAIIFLLYRNFVYGKFNDWTFDQEIAKSLLRDSWPMLLSSAFAILYSRIDQVFIKHMIDNTAVGLYDAAVRISEAWYFIPNIIVGSLFPAIVRSKKLSENIYVKRLMKLGILLLSISLISSVILMLVAKPIISILYGSDFINGSTDILKIYVWGGIGMSLGALTTSYLVSENLRKAIFTSSMITMVLNIILNLLWIPRYGIEGAAWSTAISYSIVPISILLFKIPRKHILLMFRR